MRLGGGFSGPRRQTQAARRRTRLWLPCRPAHAGAAPPDRGEQRGIVLGGGNRTAPAGVLRQRHRPSALIMIETLWRIAYSAATGFFTNRLSTSAAAMAFYTMFALGPIMIFSIPIAQPFGGRLMAQHAIF